MYSDIALLAQDTDFTQRVAACCQQEHLSPPGEHPTATAARLQWGVAAQPGLADAYAYALATGVERPGWDATVITDPQLLAATVATAGGTGTPG